MQVHFGVGELAVEWPEAVVCIGTFDGVHRGHVAVIETAVRQAQEAGLVACLVTFDRHPAAILAPERAPQLLAPMQENLRRFAECGLSATVVLPFDAELSRQSAERFFRDILQDRLRARQIVVGHDFAMGNGREGTTDWLAARMQTTVVSPFALDGERVSSSRIRDAVERGDITRANRLLGRPFRFSGVVVKGNQLGRTLGYPTANVARSAPQVIPADGVYAGVAQTRFGEFQTAIGIGKRPTVNGTNRTVEAFLLDFAWQDLYGSSIDLDFVAHIRPEAKFESLDELQIAMANDVAQTRELLRELQPSTAAQR